MCYISGSVPYYSLNILDYFINKKRKKQKRPELRKGSPQAREVERGPKHQQFSRVEEEGSQSQDAFLLQVWILLADAQLVQKDHGRCTEGRPDPLPEAEHEEEGEVAEGHCPQVVRDKSEHSEGADEK